MLFGGKKKKVRVGESQTEGLVSAKAWRRDRAAPAKHWFLELG